MVAPTANQLLRYPQTTDAPCDGDLHIGWLVDDIEAKLNSHDEDLARTLLPPALIMTNPLPQSYPASPDTFQKLVSTTIEHQVGGEFVNLAANPREFYFPRTGIYQVGLEATIDSVADLTLYYTFRFARAPAVEGVRMSVRQHNRTDPDPVNNYQAFTVSGLVRIPDTSVFYFWDWDMGFPTDDFAILRSHRAYAFWVADL